MSPEAPVLPNPAMKSPRRMRDLQLPTDYGVWDCRGTALCGSAVAVPTHIAERHGRGLLAFLLRTRAARFMSAASRPWDLPVPVQEASAHARVCDHAGSSGRSQMARPCVWPSTFGTVSAPGMIGLSRFNGWPVHSPADASPAPLRTSAHGSGPMWIATPSP